MQKPEMILFDYGFTLLRESDMDFLRGEEAVYPLIVDNPLGKTAKELCDHLCHKEHQHQKCGKDHKCIRFISRLQISGHCHSTCFSGNNCELFTQNTQG